jgi:hypothetical protein
MVETFVNDELGYLSWVHENPNGFIVNYLEADTQAPKYPMIHRATHKALWSPTRTNYTISGYLKACSNDVHELRSWATNLLRKELTPCSVCM